MEKKATDKSSRNTENYFKDLEDKREEKQKQKTEGTAGNK